MKKVFLLVLMLIAIAANAQRNYEKGTYLMGFDARGNYSHTRNIIDQKRYSYSVAPYFGYFVAKNLATGVRLSFGQRELIGKDLPTGFFIPLNSSVKAVNAELFGRYYVKNWKVKPFLELGTGIEAVRGDEEKVIFSNNGSENYELQTQSVDATNFLLTGAFGVLIPLGKKLSIDLVIRDKFTNRKQNSGGNFEGVARFGVSYRF